MTEIINYIFGSSETSLIILFGFCISVFSWFFGYGLRLFVSMIHTINS